MRSQGFLFNLYRNQGTANPGTLLKARAALQDLDEVA